MNEREVVRSYRSLQKDKEYKPYVENIEGVKSIITPKKNMELKSLLVGASEKEGTLKRYILASLDKKIGEIHRDESKESKAYKQEQLEQLKQYKIDRRKSIRKFKLKKPRKYTLRKPSKLLTPIEEGDEESSPPSPRSTSSPRSPRSTSSPRSPRSANKTQKQGFWAWLALK